MVHTFLLIATFIALVILPSESTFTQPFWISTELLHVEWKQGCASADACAEPIFRITQRNVINNEKISKSWKVVDNFEKRGVSMLVGYWTQGTPEAITIEAEMAGVDPIYGFPRVCDSTPVSAMFQMMSVDSGVDESITVNESGRKKEVIELEANCFRTRVAFAKHIVKCPWCSSVASSVNAESVDLSTSKGVIEQPEDTDRLMVIGIGVLAMLASVDLSTSKGVIEQPEDTDRLMVIGIGVLAMLAVLSSTAFICILVAFVQQRRSSLLKENRRIDAKTSRRMFARTGFLTLAISKLFHPTKLRPVPREPRSAVHTINSQPTPLSV
ncbi:Uncharacterized protein R10E12.2 [Toxocara canis]|uniref:Uncharacterized protein R10E12.2 n=1 Tax=Toxocara canis TaxID=6265 RepID=A0A0B2VCD2_TOXCA|nr:Uncharacterized protein R10E12.2 [Toxocara canis]